MKTKKAPIAAKLPKSVTINPALDDKYAGQQPFQDKIDRANCILKTVGLPSEELWKQVGKE